MIERYEQRAAAHAERRDKELRLSTHISRLRLATFIPGAACIVWALSHRLAAIPLVAGTVLLVAFAVLAVWHAQVDDRAAWYNALHVVNNHALARVGRAWDVLPPAELPAMELRALTPSALAVSPEAIADLAHHPFAIDLDLFGRASLLQWLGPAATAAGTEILEWWLLRPGTPEVVASRQQAVKELVPALDFREELAAHGHLTAGIRRAELDHFLKWAESSGPFPPHHVHVVRITALSLSVSIWLLIVLQVVGSTAAALWLIPLAIGIVLSFITARQIQGEFNRAGAGQDAFSRYAGLFAHVMVAPAEAPCLRSIRDRLTTSGWAAPERLRQLNRILGFAKLGSSAGIFHFFIQALTLWDFHVFFALDRWRRRVGPDIRRWMEAVGELDALSAFAQVKADNPEWCFPEVVAQPKADDKRFVARNLGHPLISADRRVGNDVEVGPPGTVLLITGSNMSGKSTLLRGIGLNAILAQAGAPVCAAYLRMPPLDLETSIRIQDSLEHGLSYFMAALARLKRVVDRSTHPPKGQTVMYLLDEILQGTNTAERGIAVRGVVRHLLRAGTIGVMTTHDLALAEVDPLNTAARLAHFTEIVDEHGAMTFDYRLRPGIATSRNALRLMRLIGIDVEAG